MTLAVVLATFNEESNIKRCLAAVKDIADEIIVVDGNSTDKTKQIAEKMGAKVYLKLNQPIFHINKQIAISKAKSKWILQLDADEVVDKDLKRSITAVIKQDNSLINGYFLKRKNFFLGVQLKKGGQYPDPVIRLVRSGLAHFPQKSVHEQIKVQGKVDTLDGHLLHYTVPTFKKYLTAANRYTSLTAAQLKKSRVKLSLLNWINYLFLLPNKTFFSLFFRHRGYQDKFPGFIFALFSGLHWSLAFMKYWELEKVNHTKN